MTFSAVYYFLFVHREKIMTTPRKEKKREARREEKAEKAAVLDKVIICLIACPELQYLQIGFN